MDKHNLKSREKVYKINHKSNQKKPQLDIRVTDTENESKAKSESNLVRGDLYYADLSPVRGSEQGGIRPVVIIQNDVGNKYSPTTIVAAITSVKNKTNLPTHVKVGHKACGLPRESVILLEQIRTIDKVRLKEKIGKLPSDLIVKIDNALKISIGLE